ncbi:cytoplasmic protein [Boudabousia marimammalium]|uniref:Cytoplasmic protein n=2 Tax=Boudabousia marimammalium TaxID=156892 RepID=A0A1Q5PTJ3_9ACTO|nr:cytoplasmic protein [Boudabousia marimammalium]
MSLPAAEIKPAITRLKRAKGQLEAVIRALETEQDCQTSVMQLAAVAKAIDRAGYLIVASGMKQCFSEGGDEMDAKTLEKLFLSLS